MRVLLVTPDFVPDVGGVQRLLYNFVRYTKFNVTVVAPFTKGARVFDKEQKFKIVRVPKFQIRLYLLLLWLESVKTAIKESPEIVICGHIIVGFIGYFVKKAFGIPYAVYTYGLEIMEANTWIRPYIRFILKNANIVFTISDFSKKYLLELGVNEQRIKKCHPGVDTSFFNPNIDVTPVIEKYSLSGKKVILTVARLDARERYKGHDEVLGVLPHVIKEFSTPRFGGGVNKGKPPPCLKYVIAGDGTDRPRVESLVKELNLTDYVLFTGKVTEHELAQLYVASDFLIMASKEIKTGKGLKAEGFGIVFQEAGACGKPVIAGKSGGAVEAVVDGVTGLVIDSDEESIATSMIKLLRDKNLREKMGAEARRRVVQEMDANKISREIENVLKFETGRR